MHFGQNWTTCLPPIVDASNVTTQPEQKASLHFGQVKRAGCSGCRLQVDFKINTAYLISGCSFSSRQKPRPVWHDHQWRPYTALLMHYIVLPFKKAIIY
jgi:hypothetical protein